MLALLSMQTKALSVAQKLFLIGFTNLSAFKPGSLEQLVLGTVVALLFAVVQMQCQPYKKKSDNLLATVMNLSLCLFFVSSLLYRSQELTDEYYGRLTEAGIPTLFGLQGAAAALRKFVDYYQYEAA